MDDHHREFDLENRDRLIRVEENQKSTRHELVSHISREEKQEERWLGMFKGLERKQDELLAEIRSRDTRLHQRIDEIKEEQDKRSGAEKVLIWAGGIMFSVGSAVLAWVVNHLPGGQT